MIIVGKSGKKYIDVSRGETEDSIRKQVTELVLEQYRWNVKKASSVLGVSRMGLYVRIKEWGLKRPCECSRESRPE